MPGPETPPTSGNGEDGHWALKGRISRCHGRLKQARANGEKDVVLDALASEMNTALEELHARFLETHLERLYLED